MAATKQFFTGRGPTTSATRASIIDNAVQADIPSANATVQADIASVVSANEIVDPPARFDHELVYVLFCVRYIREHAPTKPAITPTQSKHLNLLNGIALLLVTEDKSDVAAVSFRQTSTSIDFFYAKNRPCTVSEKDYIEFLLELIRNYDPSK